MRAGTGAILAFISSTRPRHLFNRIAGSAILAGGLITISPTLVAAGVGGIGTSVILAIAVATSSDSPISILTPSPAASAISQAGSPAGPITSPPRDLLPMLTVRASLSRNNIRVNETTELLVAVEWRGQPGEFEVDPPQQLVLTGLEMIESASTASTFDRGGQAQAAREFRYTLRAIREGEGVVGSVNIAYRRRLSADDSAASSSTPATGSPPAPSPSFALATTPIRMTIGAALSPLKIPWHVLGSTVGLAVFVTLFVVYLRRKREAARPVAAEVVLTPLDCLRQGLVSEEHRLVEGDIGTYYSRLEKLMLSFLEEVAGITAAGNPVRDTLEHLHPRFESSEDLVVLERFFERLDLVKFAGLRPENEEIRRETRNLLRVAESLVRGDSGKQRQEEESGAAPIRQ